YCVPRSPAHCLSCDDASDCGSLSEVCFQAQGDVAKACHIDCSIAGAAACPDDYTCLDQVVDGKPRKLCRPKTSPRCLDAQGGFCDRSPPSLPCKRTSTDGACTGQRVCLPSSKRYDKCSAPVPACKKDCSAKDPAGCITNYCGGVASGPDNCGMCGNVC